MNDTQKQVPSSYNMRFRKSRASHSIIRDHCFAHGALVGGGIDASDPSASDLLLICVLSLTGFASLTVAFGNLLSGDPVPPVVVGLFAHGAAVPTPGTKPGVDVALLAHGAFVPSPDACVVRAEAFSRDKPGPSRMGWLDAWTDVGGGLASGSWSQLKREPKRKCWTTGNLERTSASYILIMPFYILAPSQSCKNYNLTLLIFPHPALTPEIS